MDFEPIHMWRTLTFKTEIACAVCKGTLELRIEISATEIESRLDRTFEVRVRAIWETLRDNVLSAAREQQWTKTGHNRVKRRDTWVCPGADHEHKEHRRTHSLEDEG